MQLGPFCRPLGLFGIINLMYRRILLFLLVGILLTGCTYHGQIRRGIYTQTPPPERVDASVLLIADHLPTQVLIADPEEADTQAFVLQIADGTAIAATDALATLFTRADAGSADLQDKYDFIADVTLEAGLTRNNCEGTLSKWAVRQDGLCTLLTLSIRREGDETPLATATSSRWRPFRTPGFASSVRWLDKHTRIFFFILTPLYVQTQGNALRSQFEDNLKETLEDIMGQLAQKRAAFTPVP